MHLKSTLKLHKSLFLLCAFVIFSISAFGQLCGLPGSDGPATPSASVNTYFPSAVPDSVAVGATSITLGATSGTSITNARGTHQYFQQ